MQKRIKTKTLHRDSEHRKALLRNLSTSLVLNEEVVTTVAKAKYLKPYFEKLITKVKAGNTFNMVKFMKANLTLDDAVRKMFDDLGPRFTSRPGGYTRIVKLANRSGDNAPMARIEILKDTKKEVTEAVETKKTVLKKPVKETNKKAVKSKVATKSKKA